MRIDSDDDLRTFLGDDVEDHPHGGAWERRNENDEIVELDPLRDLGPDPSLRTDYTQDWMAISRRTRESVDWFCEECNRDCSNEKSKLHVHHRDGDKQNNSPDNLQVLCLKCHEDTHGHPIG